VGVGQSVVCTEGGTPTGSVTDPSLRDTLVRLGLECLERRESILETVSGTRVFAEFLDPPPWLAVIGAGDDAIPLARFAADVGFRVAVIDHRQAFLETHRFPDAKHRICARPDDAVSDVELDRAYAVIMTHSLNLDTGWVERLVGTAAPSIGLLGPRTRTARILAGVDGGSRVYGPVGLDLGADGPEQVAVSVLAEVLAVRAGREPRHLRERTEAIHVS
jgi:xanthine/CO dehydrogenase XdhC/CoxF family maturation factor